MIHEIKRGVLSFVLGAGMYGVAQLFGLSGMAVATIIVLSCAMGAGLMLWVACDIERVNQKESKDE